MLEQTVCFPAQFKMKHYPRRKIICKVCGVLKPRQAFDMCNACYRRTNQVQAKKRSEYDATPERRKYRGLLVKMKDYKWYNGWDADFYFLMIIMIVIMGIPIIWFALRG